MQSLDGSSAFGRTWPDHTNSNLRAPSRPSRTASKGCAACDLRPRPTERSILTSMSPGSVVAALHHTPPPSRRGVDAGGCPGTGTAGPPAPEPGRGLRALRIWILAVVVPVALAGACGSPQATTRSPVPSAVVGSASLALDAPTAAQALQPVLGCGSAIDVGTQDASAASSPVPGGSSGSFGPPAAGPSVAPSGSLQVGGYADLVAANRAYVSYATSTLAILSADVDTLRADLARSDLPSARRDWLAAQLDWERVGASYDSFGALGIAADGLPDGLPGGVNDPGFQRPAPSGVRPLSWSGRGDLAADRRSSIDRRGRRICTPRR